MSDNNPFNIVGQQQVNPGTPLESNLYAGEKLNSRLEKIINSDKVVAFVKGTPDFPQCGFSANTMGILNTLGVPYKTFDILTDESVRQGLKSYSNWPTFPQVYINGKLIGGNDIISELYQDGELQELVK